MKDDQTFEVLPFLTADLPGIGGQFKVQPADFYVEEIPLYQPSGVGEHTYLTFEKTGMTTMSAMKRIAQSLGIHYKQIGYAGLKDAQAVTQQTISLGQVSPDRVTALHLNGIRVVSVSKHRNKLKVGHLAGNKFIIYIRQVEPSALPQAQTILEKLMAQGIPNYFGQQRFGVRYNSHRLGLALIRDEPTAFLAELLGKPTPKEMPQARQARLAYDAGQLEEALQLWPPSLRQERLVLEHLVKKGDERAAIKRIDRRLQRLYISAYQSYLFNHLLTQRLPTLAKLEQGDVAYIHRNGAAFVVNSVAAEQPRADSFEISPAGPLFGKKYLAAEGIPGEREFLLLQQAQLSPDAFDIPGVHLSGGRRPYRIPLTNVELDWDEGLRLAFQLPPGVYATMVLREVMKPQDDEAYILQT